MRQLSEQEIKQVQGGGNSFLQQPVIIAAAIIAYIPIYTAEMLHSFGTIIKNAFTGLFGNNNAN